MNPTTTRSLSAAVAVASAVTMAAYPAHAQSSAAAEALYREGQHLMQIGSVHDACIKFAESERLEPATGTLLNLANCHEREGKTASAWSEYSDAVAMARQTGQKDREDYARKHAEVLEKKLRNLLVVVADAPAGAEVTLDGEAFAAIGSALPADPGEHEISVSAPKKKTWTQKVALQPGPGTTRVDVPRLEDVQSETPVAVLPPSDARRASPTDTAAGTGKAANPKRTAGYVVGAAGLAALGAGIFFGVRAKLFNDKSDREQARAIGYGDRGDAINTQVQHGAAVDDHDSAKSSQTAAFIAGGVAIAALGVGAYLVLTSKSKEVAHEPAARVTPLIAPGSAGASASFVF